MTGGADWSRTCEGCAHVVDEPGPKGALAEAERWVNNYPRRLLEWKSAAELFGEEMQAA